MGELNNRYNDRNCSIDMFRIICAILVVAIHTALLEDINSTAGYIANQVIPIIAVPFFFCVSGFYYIKGLVAKKHVFKKTVKKLLIVYTIWSFIYFLINFYWGVIKQQESIGVFIKNTVVNYFITGSYYHMWFFPALFFCIFAATFFNKIKALGFLAYCSIPLYILGLLGCSYYNLANQIPIISLLINSSHFIIIRRILLMGLPFFMLGYFLNRIEEKYDIISNKKLLAIGGIILALFLIEIVIMAQLGLQVVILTFGLYPLLGIIMMLLLNNPLSNKSSLAHYTREIANFIFYSHPICIMLLEIVGKKLFHIKVEGTPMFILTCVFTILAGWGYMTIKEKYIHKAFVLKRGIES